MNIEGNEIKYTCSDDIYTRWLNIKDHNRYSEIGAFLKCCVKSDGTLNLPNEYMETIKWYILHNNLYEKIKESKFVSIFYATNELLEDDYMLGNIFENDFISEIKKQKIHTTDAGKNILSNPTLKEKIFNNIANSISYDSQNMSFRICIYKK